MSNYVALPDGTVLVAGKAGPTHVGDGTAYPPRWSTAPTWVPHRRPATCIVKGCNGYTRGRFCADHFPKAVS